MLAIVINTPQDGDVTPTGSAASRINLPSTHSDKTISQGCNMNCVGGELRRYANMLNMLLKEVVKYSKHLKIKTIKICVTYFEPVPVCRQADKSDTFIDLIMLSQIELT